MKAIRNALGILAIALVMPLSAGAASAAQVPHVTGTPSVSGATTSQRTGQPTGLVTKSVQPKTIKVAGRRGRGLALGIIAGVATAAILSRAARGHDRYYYRSYHRKPRYRRRHRCDRWADKCDYGNDRACYKYDRYCY